MTLYSRIAVCFLVPRLLNSFCREAVLALLHSRKLEKPFIVIFRLLHSLYNMEQKLGRIL